MKLNEQTAIENLGGLVGGSVGWLVGLVCFGLIQTQNTNSKKSEVLYTNG